MIKRDTLAALPIFDMRVGDQTKFNHGECSAGPDARQRLYVIRKEHGLWLAYCHNCGESGFLAATAKGRFTDHSSVLKNLVEHYGSGGSPLLEDEMVRNTFKTSLPKDTMQWVLEWGIWVHKRLWASHISPSEAVLAPYEWGYSPSLDQLIIPIYNDDVSAALLGFQARCKPGEKPKCITTYFPEKNGEPLIYRGASPCIVIVEDPLSALRLRRDTGHSAMALLGTHLNDVAFTALLRAIKKNGFEEVVIWMDDDAAGRESSAKIFARVRGIYNRTLEVRAVRLPEARLYTAEELKGVKI